MTRSTDERSRTAQLTARSLDRAVAGARAGDAAAFRLLYREFQPLLLRYLRFLVGDRSGDVAARAWEQAASGLGAHRGGYADFRGWLARLARELTRDDTAGPGLRGLGGGGSAPPPDYATLTGPDATDAALRMIAELSPEEAEAVLLRSVLGLDARRAARVTGQRPRAVRAASRRGLGLLAGRV